ncbi:MAG: aldo/keto reductase [Dehalococcoidia bacterium]|nr:aldo/keto reductase [Dehalococcoidia bacterium]
METAQLGGTGVEVSRLGFGGVPAGLAQYLDDYDPARDADREGVIAAVQRAVELGITYFDTAPGYGGGAGESIYGEGLEGSRGDIFLATKVSGYVADVRASVEDSLKLLRTDRVDLVQVHGNSYTDERAAEILAPGGTLEQLEALKGEGLIHFVGFTSEDNNAAVFRFIDSGRFDVMQISYNLLHQHPAEWTRPFGSLFEARDAGVGVVTMRTLTSGIFQKWVSTVRPGDDFDYTPSLLQFVLSNPLVNVALVGMRTVDEVECNVATANDLSGRVDHRELHRKYPER